MVKNLFVLVCMFLFLATIPAHAEMITKVFVLEEGQYIDLISVVEWPVVAAWADFDRPVKIGPIMTQALSFQQEFKNGIIYGPVVITLRYGNPYPDPVTTPDAIGGGE